MQVTIIGALYNLQQLEIDQIRKLKYSKMYNF